VGDRLAQHFNVDVYVLISEVEARSSADCVKTAVRNIDTTALELRHKLSSLCVSAGAKVNIEGEA